MSSDHNFRIFFSALLPRRGRALEDDEKAKSSSSLGFFRKGDSKIFKQLSQLYYFLSKTAQKRDDLYEKKRKMRLPRALRGATCRWPLPRVVPEVHFFHVKSSQIFLAKLLGPNIVAKVARKLPQTLHFTFVTHKQW